MRRARERRAPVQKCMMQFVDRARRVLAEMHDDQRLRLRDVAADPRVEEESDGVHRAVQLLNILRK